MKVKPSSMEGERDSQVLQSAQFARELHEYTKINKFPVFQLYKKKHYNKLMIFDEEGSSVNKRSLIREIRVILRVNS